MSEPPPKTHCGDLADLPAALKPLVKRRRWVVWKWELDEKGKWTKPPYRGSNPTQHASSSKPSTWCDYATAVKAVRGGHADGIGFMLKGSGVNAVDLDGCYTAETGVIDNWAADTISRAPGAYIEITPSGSGLRIIGIGRGVPIHKKFAIADAQERAAVELYRRATRYITVSGLQLGACDKLPNIGALLDSLLSEHAAKPRAKRSKPNSRNAAPGIDGIIKNGAPKGDRSQDFSRVVWSLASMGHAADEIERRLAEHPNGIAAKYAGRLKQEIERCYSKWLQAQESAAAAGVRLEDFRAYMPMHSYIFTPCREMWPASSVNARLPAIEIGTDPETGETKTINANAWLDRNRPVEQMIWTPGRPMLIENKLMADGGWLDRDGVTCFNLYRPPSIEPGNAAEADPWLDHAHRVFAADAEHIVPWLAHRVQRPQEKINHALVLGGAQGIGKDTLLEPVKAAVGPWNFREVSPQQMLGRFNGFLKSVVLRISEARDLGDVNRYQFYDHLKAYTAAPPDVLRCDEKHLREHSVVNCCGVIITTNHKTDGIYLPADDRRHFVAWSDLTKLDFTADYWNRMWNWYASGGIRHVVAYLAELDISKFDPKAPPPKTPAFWDIVDASRAPEDAELADVLDKIGNPDAITLTRIQNESSGEFEIWIRDRKNRRAIPHRMENCGYAPVRNDAAKDGLWKISGKRQAVYARAALSVRDRLQAARRLCDQRENHEAFDQI